jgi:DNA-binding beta-propeller fold protein YncE
MEQVEDISRRTSGGLSLDVAYTADGSYPFIWYLRSYPNASQLPNPPSGPDLDKPVIIAGDAEWSGIEPYLGANYTCTRYNFLWWPMQDYYGLTWDRIRYALTNPDMRAAVWDIIFRRDYRKYEQVTGKTVRLSEWPLRDGFRLCTRRDLIAQVWSERARPIDYVPEIVDTGPTLPNYSGLERPAAAELVVSALGSFGNLNAPHGIALDADGFLYVADSNNHRVVKVSSEGEVVDTWDSTWWRGLQSWKPGCLDANDRPLSLGDGEFCEPWGITVGADGRVYVADTWNHRIQVFTSDGEFQASFGTFGQSGSSVSSAPSQFYGPRDVVVDDLGYIYVTDTGNKRIQVFDSDLQHVRSFGGPGIVGGRLDEPVGLALDQNGLLYVADTWNNRVQVLTSEGAFVREWPIVGWESESVSNKPYLATDSAGSVFVSDPEGLRILVFSDEGTPLAVLGGTTSALLQLPTGVVLDDQNHIWVSDAGRHRLLRIPSLDLASLESQP